DGSVTAAPGAAGETGSLRIRSFSILRMMAPRFSGWRASVNRYAVLYLVTLFVIVPLDFLFLGLVARDFFTSQVGNMLGEIKLAPAILFYLIYVVGTVVFVSGGQGATWPTQLLFGALFGVFSLC